MSKAAYTNTKQLLNRASNAWDLVYFGLNHYQAQSVANFIKAEGVDTIKQFLKTNFDYCGELSVAKREAINELQTKVNKYMSKVSTKKVAKKTKVVAKKQTKAVAKKIVAKKLTKKETIKAQYTKLYKIVSNYSENLLQDVYSVVYRTKTLKRFVNTNLANRFIEQEVLLRMNEHAITTAKKSRAVSKELESEFA